MQWSLSYNSFVISMVKKIGSHNMTVLYSYPYYNEVSYKEVAFYINCRFSLEEKAKRDPFVFMPFGHGPRNCIGMRLALLEAKMAIIHALKKVTFVKSPETEVSVIYYTPPHFIP